jgi:hypothetical protein
MAQPHERDGLSAWRMAVLWTFREPSLCRRVHRALMRNALLDYTPIIPATACHQSNYVETYSRYIGQYLKQTYIRSLFTHSGSHDG